MKKITSIMCAHSIFASSLSILPMTAAASSESSVEFSIFGSAEKKFTITTQSSDAVYDAEDMYQESKDNKIVGISATAGIIGHPVDVELVSGTDDPDAEISFKFDNMLLNGAQADHLTIAKYNKKRKRMELLDTEYQEMGSTVTAHTSGAGQYALVDRDKWYEIWKQGQLIIRDPVVDSDHFNVIFAIDTSGSMDTDRRDKSKDCVFEFMSQLEEGDRFTVVGFNSDAETLVRTKTISENFDQNDYFDVISEGIDSMSGGTSFDAALTSAADYVTNDKNYTNLVIMLSDGESSVSDSTLQRVIDNHAYVATIGLETSESGSETLERIAAATAGRYYDATSENISAIFEGIREENIGVDIKYDTDGDNIPDKIESEGMRTRFGQVIKTNPKKNDTDGDGFSDSAEVGEVMYDEDVSELDKEYNLGKYVYYVFSSDPTVADDTPENSVINKLDGTVHIYNETEADVDLDDNQIKKVTSPTQAEKYMSTVLGSLSDEQKESSLVAAKVALLEEELMSQATKIKLNYRQSINIKDSMISTAVSDSEKLQSKLDSIVDNSDVEQRRNIRRYITIEVNNDDYVEINKEKLSSDILGVRVVTPYASLRMSTETVGKVTLRNEGNRRVGVYYGDKVPKLEATPKPTSTQKPAATPKPTPMPASEKGYLEENGTVVLSIKGLDKRNELATIEGTDREPKISKYNDATGNVETKIQGSDSYQLIENKIEFDDLKGKPKEMKEAIRKLTAQNIVNGVAPGEFSPDDMITRAQVATIMVRMLSELDPNEDGGFIDVHRTDWFFGAAGSSKRCGIINGYEDNSFRGNDIIPKVQIIAIEARTMKNEMGYKDPIITDSYFDKFKDKYDIADWSKEEIAFAVRENLILRRIDGTFSGEAEISRGDAAIEIQRAFEKWLL